MADTSVAITAGSGTNIDTRTESSNGNHRQVVVIGDPTTNAGVAPVDQAKGVSVNVTNANEYEYVAASATSQALGATGASGDYLSHLTIIPATTSPGAVSLQDGGGTDRTIFTGGASSVSNLQPFHVILGAASVNGAWKVTTGSNVAVYAFGDFT